RDAYNNVIEQLIYNDADTQIYSYDALNNRTEFLYDRNMRQTGTIDAEGNTTTSVYDSRGNVSTRTDADGNTTTYQYDGENRLIKVSDPLGNSTSYTYDAAGNKVSQTDGNGNTATYQYNAANKLIGKIDPNGVVITGRTESYTYYANGRMASKTDRNSITTSYTYDFFGRLTEEDAGGEVQSYTYDANGNLLTMDDATGITYRTYDELNRNISKTVPDVGKSIYEYDLPAEEAGEYAERTTDPKGNATIKTYDKAARLSKVQVGEDTTVYEYNRNGSRYRVIYPDGTTETYHYDRKNQITSLVNAKADQSVISSYQYTYDPASNQLSKTEGKGTTTYTYDSLNRISTVSEPDGKVTTYTYDGAGNRKAEKVEKGLAGAVILYNYNEQNRLISTLASDGTETKFLYDRNGNLLSKSSGKSELLTIVEDDPVKLPDFGLIIVREDENGTGTKYLNLNTYDHYNRLISSKTEKSTAKYRYNAQGYRVEKTVNDNTTRYLYEADKVVLETDENNNQEAFQAYGSNLLYRTTAADDEMGAQSYYYLYNAHGDVTALIDAQGNIAVTYDYDAFGNILSESGTANNSIKYAGYQFDEESGLYYLNARYYDSVTARFITEDSYTGQKNDPLSLNLYTYCFNNPIIYTDPTGHATVSIVDYLKKQGEDSSYSSRKELAKELGIKNYSGTAAQNTQLLKTLQKQEKAERIAAENAAAKKAAEERIAAIKRAASASSVVKNTITDNDKNVKKKTSQVTNPSPTATPTNNVNKGTGNATNTVQENTFVFNPNGTIAVTGGVIAGEEVAKVVVSNPYVAATVILTGVFTLLWPAKEVNVGENEWIAERKKTHQNTEGADNSTVNSIPNKYPWNELPTTGEHPFEPKVDKSGNPVLKKGPKGEIIDKYGNEWTMDKQGAKVDNPHWDVTHKDGSHTNVNPESSENAGEVNHGKDNFK
ncbi:MAG: repeat-associated core domain protein, partial [Herbinix sp.]|nr:repeat-associated core domain protein [Herbinix sp.]